MDIDTALAHSQFGQDRWVIALFNGKHNGFFIELGAGDGIHMSNTLLLEKKFGWTGILIEPTTIFAKLAKNRPNCIVDNSCVASGKKNVNIFEVSDSGQPFDNLLFSTVREDLDVKNGESLNGNSARFIKAYQKETIPLWEILQKHKAPKIIDYFSLDVEGGEYEVLRNFPFGEYTFLCLGVERPSKELHKLLKKKGYILVAQIFDNMYVNNRIGKFLLLRILILNIFLIPYFNFKILFHRIKRVIYHLSHFKLQILS